MALFGSSKKEVSQSSRINPTVMQSYNVGKDLSEFAKRNRVDLATIDFNILEVRTQKRDASQAENSWSDIEDTKHIQLDIKSEVLNPSFEIKQLYEIEIFQKSNTIEDPLKDFHIAIGANATKCKIYLSIKESSRLVYVPHLEKLLQNHIDKAKLKANIFIHIFDEMVDDVISKLSAKARVNGELVFDTAQNLLVAESFEPVATIDDRLINHFEKKEKKELEATDKIDYSNRGFLKTVAVGDVLIEYIKPKLGSAGRNCRGEFLKPSEPIVKNIPNCEFDDTIEEQEDENKILYKAKISGYIQTDGKKYTIASEMDVAKLDFKTTGSIIAGVDSDVVINVEDASWEEDAIGDGMKIEVSELNTKGNVGDGTSIKAKKVTIGGQTHKNSTIEAIDIDINTHKGIAIGENVKVTRLENGIIKAKNVKVTQVLGGTIEAANLEVDICSSMLKAYASSTITINKLQGKDSIFTIDPLIQSAFVDKFEQNSSAIETLRDELKLLDKDIQKYEKFIQDSQATFDNVKERIVYYKQNNIKIPDVFIKKYRDFLAIQKKLEELKIDCKQKKEKLDLLVIKTKKLQEAIFEARIINNDKWSGQDTVAFRLIDPKIELTFIPPADYPFKIFGVIMSDDGEFEIKGYES